MRTYRFQPIFCCRLHSPTLRGILTCFFVIDVIEYIEIELCDHLRWVVVCFGKWNRSILFLTTKCKTVCSALELWKVYLLVVSKSWLLIFLTKWLKTVKNGFVLACFRHIVILLFFIQWCSLIFRLLRGQGASFRAKQIILGSWELLDCGLNTSYQWCSPIQSIC